MEAGIALLRGDVLELERGFWSPGCARGTGKRILEPGMCQGDWREASGAWDVPRSLESNFWSPGCAPE